MKRVVVGAVLEVGSGVVGKHNYFCKPSSIRRLQRREKIELRLRWELRVLRCTGSSQASPCWPKHYRPQDLLCTAPPPPARGDVQVKLLSA